MLVVKTFFANSKKVYWHQVDFIIGLRFNDGGNFNYANHHHSKFFIKKTSTTSACAVALNLRRHVTSGIIFDDSEKRHITEVAKLPSSDDDVNNSTHHHIWLLFCAEWKYARHWASDGEHFSDKVLFLHNLQLQTVGRNCVSRVWKFTISGRSWFAFPLAMNFN